MIVAPKAYLNYFLIAIILIVILAIFLFIILYRKRKKKRPKLLRELESEGQATE
jgi:preprotein translocase subunit YajC